MGPIQAFVRKKSMMAGDPLQAETSAEKPDDAYAMDAAAESETAQKKSKTDSPSVRDEAELREDDAWLDACRTELDDDTTDENEADLADSPETGAAIKKTGDDAMSKFGHAIGALAEHEDDLDDHALDYAAEMASPSKSRDEGVAPHIAAAERELERSKSSGPVDIFDRIAQAAESQFDGARGSTTKRVSELVDDRRVGTKRWTPSKTMKKRMEKLEAARNAASGTNAGAGTKAAVATAAAGAGAAIAATAATAAPASKKAEEAPVIAASAPSSSTATMVSPTAKKKPAPEPDIEIAPMTEDQSVSISRRDRHPDAKENTETESTGANDAIAEDEEELDADGLRVVPGARGRRRDRARKSRLDEDFEKIFDDEGKPSINSLRRKLRSGAAEEEAEAEDSQATGAAKTVMAGAEAAPRKGLFSRLLKSKKSAVATTVELEDTLDAPTVTEEQFGADPVTAPKKSMLSGLVKSKGKKASVALPEDEDELVSAFESDETDLDFEGSEDEDWQTAVDNERKQKQIAMPIIGAGIFIALGGVGWFAYKFLMGM